jgi:hypothetical protein
MHNIYIVSENGSLYYWDGKRLITQFHRITPDYLMGITEHKGVVYLSSRSQILSFQRRRLSGMKKSEVFKPPCDFHHAEVIDSKLYVTVTRFNEIWVFDLELNLLEKHIIAPPKKGKAKKPNYNHINKIIKHEDKFYVNLNWFEKQFGPSGVAVLDSDMNELERYKMGWQTHGFRFIDDKRYVLCASTPGKKLDHPHSAGLMVENELVFEHDPDEYFCKDFEVTEKNIYIVGGSASKRDDRKFADGVLFVLDRNFKLLKKHTFESTGGFKGCLN